MAEQQTPRRQDDPIIRELHNRIVRLEKLPHRRRDDPIIKSIQARLDTLEDLSSDMKEIKEWIATVVKVTRMLELLGGFFGRAAVLVAKVSAGLMLLWLASKSSLLEALITIRDFWRGAR